MLALAFVLAAMAAPAPAAGDAPPTVCRSAVGGVTVYGETLSLGGSIDDAVADCFAKAYTPAIRYVAVDLSGGDTSPSLRIADLIAGRRVPVTVRGICASGCASFILPAASVIRVDPTSIILFHNTATSVVAMNEGRRWPALDQYRRWSERERALYQRMGIDPALLTLPQQLIGTICVVEPGGASGRPGDIGFMARYAAASFTQRTLETMGMKFDGRFAATMEAMSAGIASGAIHQSPAVLNKVTFARQIPDPPTVPKNLVAGLPRLPVCTRAQRASARP